MVSNNAYFSTNHLEASTRSRNLSFVMSFCRTHLSPNNNPLLWVIINAVCALASLTLLIMCIKGYEAGAQKVYLEYSVITTISWCIELGIKMRYHSPDWLLLLELLVAIYFTVDSTRTIYLWAALKQRPETLTYSLAVDFCIFIAGTVVDAIPLWRNKELTDPSVESDLSLNANKEPIQSQMV